MSELTAEELIKLRNDLNEASDKLSIKIKQFEDDLKKLGLGVFAWVELSGNTSIGYQRYNGEWRLLVKYNDFGEEKTKPLIETDRTLRVYCYNKVDKLIPALEESAKHLLEKINHALSEANDFEKTSL